MVRLWICLEDGPFPMAGQSLRRARTFFNSVMMSNNMYVFTRSLKPVINQLSAQIRTTVTIVLMRCVGWKGICLYIEWPALDYSTIRKLPGNFVSEPADQYHSYFHALRRQLQSFCQITAPHITCHSCNYDQKNIQGYKVKVHRHGSRFWLRGWLSLWAAIDVIDFL